MNHTTAKSLTTGEVARRSGVGIETVRFCEREGLVAQALRTASGCRQFAEKTIARLQVRFDSRETEPSPLVGEGRSPKATRLGEVRG